MYSTTGKLWTFAQEKRKLTDTNENGEKWNTNFIKYKFKDGDPKADSQTIHIEFWNDPAYFVDWKFDKQSNKYVRNNGGKPHIDRNTNKQLTASNIVVLFMNEKHADDGYENNSHLLYGTKGEGKALIFQNGTEIKGTWKKASRTARTLIYDQSGQEIEFNRGKIWFEILPTDAVVKAE
jgi:hypothetical protein